MISYWIGENICSTDKEIISYIKYSYSQRSTIKKQISPSRNGERRWRNTSLKKTYSQLISILKIVHCHLLAGNINRNDNEYHTSENGIYHKRLETNSVGGIERKDVFFMLEGMSFGSISLIVNSLETSQKGKTKGCIWPNDSTFWHLHKNIHLKKTYMHTYVHCNFKYYSQDVEQPKCPTAGEQLDKVLYTQ